MSEVFTKEFVQRVMDQTGAPGGWLSHAEAEQLLGRRIDSNLNPDINPVDPPANLLNPFLYSPAEQVAGLFTLLQQEQSAAER